MSAPSRLDAFEQRLQHVSDAFQPEKDSLRDELAEGLYHVLMTGHASCTHPSCPECLSAVIALAKSAQTF